MTQLRRLPPSDWPLLADFIHRHNQRPDGRVRCLHAEQGTDAQAHAQELAALSPDEGLFLVAAADDTAPPLAMIGAESDPQLRRAWLRGPLVANDAPDLPRRLIDATLDALPAVDCFDAFPAVDETALIAAYRAAGFEDRLQHHVMRLDTLPPDARAPDAGIAIADAPADDPSLAGLPVLHDALFPGSYLAGAAIASTLDEDHRLFVASESEDEAGRLLGYVYIQHKRHEPEGYVDFVGVDEAARGRGVGRALLWRAAQWALHERQLPCVHLTVRQDRAPALGLYESLGFREVAAGLHLQRRR